jgi:hypothetical protein
VRIICEHSIGVSRAELGCARVIAETAEGFFDALSEGSHGGGVPGATEGAPNWAGARA